MNVKGTYYIQDTTLSSQEKELLFQYHDNIYCATIFGRNIKNFDLITKYSQLENLEFENIEYLLKELEIYKLKEKKGEHREKEEIISESKALLKDLIKEIKSYDSRIKIAIDCEGGSVYRLPWSKHKFQNLSKFGELYQINPELAKEQCYQQYDEIAKELQEFGIDINFAPVLDIQTINKSGNKNFIFNRAASDNSVIISEITSCAIDAMLDNNIISTLKHIPGHGGTSIDTHHNIAVIDKSLEALINEDSMSFKNITKKYTQEINDGKIIAMLSHIKYNALDSNNIAPMSAEVAYFIKNEIGFKGLLISDAIEMKALVNFFNMDNNNPDFKFITQELNDANILDIILFCGCGMKNIENALADHLSIFQSNAALDIEQAINYQPTMNIFNITINYTGDF